MSLNACQLCPLLLPHSHYWISGSSKFQRNDWPMADAKEKFAVPSHLEFPGWNRRKYWESTFDSRSLGSGKEGGVSWVTFPVRWRLSYIKLPDSKGSCGEESTPRVPWLLTFQVNNDMMLNTSPGLSAHLFPHPYNGEVNWIGYFKHFFS